MFKIPKISYSLLASLGKGELVDQLKSFDRLPIDMIHYDISDAAASLPVDQLATLKKASKIPFDIHIACADPNRILSQVSGLDSQDGLCIHLENGFSRDELLGLRSRLGCKIGLAINVETATKQLLPFLDAIDFVLFMAATPGVSGGSFNEAVIDKIKEFERYNSEVAVHVDGGINNFTASVLRDLGVDVLISGSYILKSEDYTSQISKLVGLSLGHTVDHFLYSGERCPVVAESDDVRQVAKEIDDKGIGCACVFGPNKEFQGLITDTDIRRALTQGRDLSSLRALDIMNRNPFKVQSGVSLSELIRVMETGGKQFTIIPVVDGAGRGVGIIRIQDILFANVDKLRIRIKEI